jgi:hypothetical protein
LWLGRDDLSGKAILLWSEHGLGDTIQFCRYAKRVSDLGATGILEAPKPLVQLLANLPGVSKVIAKGSPLRQVDYQPRNLI